MLATALLKNLAGVDVVKNIEELCAALILLQEIALGYDNNWYRERCGKALRSSTSAACLRTLDIISWKAGNISTPDMIDKVERLILEYGTSIES